MPAAMHDQLADSDLACLLQSIADHGVALISPITIRHEVVGLFPIATVVTRETAVPLFANSNATKPESGR